MKCNRYVRNCRHKILISERYSFSLTSKLLIIADSPRNVSYSRGFLWRFTPPTQSFTNQGPSWGGGGSWSVRDPPSL